MSTTLNANQIKICKDFLAISITQLEIKLEEAKEKNWQDQVKLIPVQLSALKALNTNLK